MVMWRAIPEFENYQVSNSGQVRRIKQTWNNLPKTLKPWVESHGYNQVELSNKNGQKTFRVHRLVLCVFIGPPPKGQVCNHKDGDKQNNKLDNLEWVSSSDNMKHAYKTGLHGKTYGSASHLSKLTDQDVKEIKKLLSDNIHKFIKIAQMYNVSRHTIYDIRDKKTWGHIL